MFGAGRYVVRAVDAAGVTSFSQVVKTGADLPVLKGTQNQPLFVAPVQPLTSTNKSVTFLNAFSSCRNQIVKDNGPGAASEGVFAYLPNPTTVQMSTISAAEGTMPLAFGQLNNVAVEQTIASAQARYLLPCASLPLFSAFEGLRLMRERQIWSEEEGSPDARIRTSRSLRLTSRRGTSLS